MNDIYSSPQSELEETEELDLELASRWSRLFAVLIDGVIGMLFSIPMMMYFGHLALITQGETPPIIESVIIGFLGLIFYMIVHGYFLSKNGQSIGKNARYTDCGFK